MRHRDDIDGLRALAVLPVVFYHLALGPFSGGYVGVDVFFVISGFLITAIIAREIEAGRFSIVNFYERRIRRIYPAGFAVVAATMAAGWILMPSLAFKQLSLSTIFYNLYATNFLFWSQSGYFDPRADTKPLLHTWSLSVEEQFYIFFPLFLVGVFYLLRKRWTWAVGIATIGSFLLSCYAAYRAPTAGFYLIPLRAWELGLGAWLAMIDPELLLRRIRIAPALIAACGVALIGFAVFAFDDETRFPGAAALAPCAGAALLLLAGRSANPVSACVGNPVFRYIGLISYSLYLWHWPVLVFARYFYFPDPIDLTGKLLLLVVIWILSDLSWRLVETPFRTRKLLPTRRGIFGFFGATTAALLAIGGFGYLGNGLPWRLPAQAAVLESAAEDSNPLRSTCHDGDGGHVATIEDFCVYGNKARPPTFALWGDSHGVELASALGSLLGESGGALKSFTASLCPPATPFPTYRHAGCETHNRQVLAYLDAHPEIGTVYMVANYHHYLTPKLKEPFKVGFLAAARSLAAAGKKVVVIHPVPITDYPIPAMAAILEMRGKDPNRAAIARSDYDGMYAEANAFLTRELTGDAFAHAYPTDALCTDASCKAVLNGQPLYFDDNHLSMHGARFVATALRNELLIPAAPTHETKNLLP
jgi:peptidoglycan/LPS O-acetylase OafA/YrhL